MKLKSFDIWILTVSALLVIGYHAATFTWYPKPFADESMIGCRAVSWAETAEPFCPMEEGYRIATPRQWAAGPILPYVIHGLALGDGNTVDLVRLRAVSVFFGIILLLAVYGIAARIDTPFTGNAALLLLAFSPGFLFSGRVTRLDILSAAFGYAALFLHCAGAYRRLLVHFAAGVCFAVAVECNPRALILGPAAAALFLFDCRFAVLRSKALWSTVLGTAAGLALYYAVHVYPDPNGFLQGYREVIGPSRAPPIVHAPATGIALALREILSLLWSLSPFTLLLAACALPIAVLTRSTSGARLSLSCGALVLAAAMVIRSPMSFNLIMVSPAIELLAAYSLVAICHSGTQSIVRLGLAASVSISAAALLIVFPALRVAPGRVCWSNHAEAEQFLKSTIKPDEVVMGPQHYWVGFQRSKYLAWEGLKFYQLYHHLSLDDARKALGVQLMIVDDEVRWILDDTPMQDARKEDMRVSKTDFTGMLALHADRIGSYQTACEGALEVYRFRD